MHIRRLKCTDYVVTRKLFNLVFDISEDPHFVKAWRERSKVRSVGCWIKFGGSVASLVGAAIVKDDNCLAFVFVHPDFQRLGIGSRLIRYVLEIRPTLYLVPVDDAAVVGWYKSLGFKLSSQKGPRMVLVKHGYGVRK
jgi:ribosomal protein S18 acetylase RimI-like enzyme